MTTIQLDKFPDSYPFMNEHGDLFTETGGVGHNLTTLYYISRKIVGQMGQNPDNWGLEIAETLLKAVNKYNGNTGVPIECYLRVQLQYKISTVLRDNRKYITLPGGERIQVSEVQLNEDLLEIDTKDLTDQKSILYSVLRAVNTELGPRAESVARLIYAGYIDSQIVDQLKISTSTLSRTKKELKEFLKEI